MTKTVENKTKNLLGGHCMWETLYQLRRKDQNGRYETIWAKAPCKGWKTIQKIRVCQPSPLQPAICTL